MQLLFDFVGDEFVWLLVRRKLDSVLVGSFVVLLGLAAAAAVVALDTVVAVAAAVAAVVAAVAAAAGIDTVVVDVVVVADYIVRMPLDSVDPSAAAVA